MLENLDLLNFHSIKKYLYSIKIDLHSIKSFYAIKSHGKLSDDQYILLLLLFIVIWEEIDLSQTDYLIMGQRVFIWRQFFPCVQLHVLQTSFGRTFLWREAPASRSILGNEPCNVDSAWNDVGALRLNVEPLYRSMSLARFTTWPTCKFSRWLVLPKVAAKRRLSSSATRAKLTMWFYRIIILFLVEGRYFFME